MANIPNTSLDPAGNAHRILIVDDDPAMRRLVTSHLAAAGFDALEADNADDAFTILCRREAELLITDWEMPRTDGIALCRRIREHKELGYFYIIMLTSRCSRDEMLCALDAGADEFLKKPVDRHELWARVRVGLRFVAIQAAIEQRNMDLCRASADLLRANRQLQTIAMYDALTGLLNRQEGLKQFTGVWTLTEPVDEPLCCIMLDVDHFKRINDTYGHDTGDEVLRSLAVTLRQTCRSEDIIARLGGEEFIVVCPQMDIAETADTAERLRRAVEDTPIDTASGEVRITCSFGVAQRELQMQRPEALLRIADQSLYAAKAHGRNRVALADLSDNAPHLPMYEVIDDATLLD